MLSVVSALFGLAAAAGLELIGLKEPLWNVAWNVAMSWRVADVFPALALQLPFLMLAGLRFIRSRTAMAALLVGFAVCSASLYAETPGLHFCFCCSHLTAPVHAIAPQPQRRSCLPALHN